MSHIIKEKQDLLIIKDMIANIKIENFNKENTENIIKVLIPKDNNNTPLIDYIINQKGTTRAKYSPRYSTIELSINQLTNWIEQNSKEIIDVYKIKNIEKLKQYLILFIFTHEIEHSYQHLIAQEKTKSPCDLIKNGYKNIFDLLLATDSVISNPIKEMRKAISKILYLKDNNLYILERNANYEALDLLCKLSIINNDEEMYMVFSDIKNQIATIGYQENNKGSLEETYKKL